jgi:hypothetical protein
MKILRKETNLETSLIILYFLLGLIEVIVQLFKISQINYIIMPLLVLLLSVLYWHTSKRRSSLFLINIGLLLLGRLFFISTENNLFFYALIAIFFHRIVEIYYISKLIKLNDYIPPVLASLPFLFFFLCLVSLPENIFVKSYIILILQIALISILSGIILAQYILSYDKKDVWLFIFGLMTLMQTFIIFIEKFYLPDINIYLLRPSSFFLNTIICFSFYKFVIVTEGL